MKAKLFDLSVAAFHLTPLGAPVVADASPYVVTSEQIGSNVVAPGSGNTDLTGLCFRGERCPGQWRHQPTLVGG
jgi:hypothetical protein